MQLSPTTKTAMIGGSFAIVASLVGVFASGLVGQPNPPPTELNAKISPLSSPQAANKSIQFSAAESTAYADSRIIKYEWDFDDGHSDSGARTFHSFERAQSYQIKLTVTDDKGRTDQDAFVLDIDAETSSASSQQPADDPAKLISISSIAPRQQTYRVGDVAYVDFSVEQKNSNMPYTFFAYWYRNGVWVSEVSKSTVLAGDYVYIDSTEPGTWEVKVVVTWQYEGKSYSVEKATSYVVEAAEELISVSSLVPLQETYLVGDEAHARFHVTSPNNTPYTFTGHFFWEGVPVTQASDSLDFTRTSEVWIVVDRPGTWTVQVVVEWQEGQDLKSIVRETSFAVE